MTFASREDAGRQLGGHLLERKLDLDLVLGLPRGGVVVAAEVARILQRPLEVLVVRKIGHPFHREFAVGALAEHGVALLDDSAIGSDAAVRDRLKEIMKDEKLRLLEYESRFHIRGQPDLDAKRVLLVDDGLATGASVEAAVLSAGIQGARRIIVGVPVASTSAVERLGRVADDVVCLVVDPDFGSVGSYYDAFSQTTDETVLDLLRAASRTG